MIRALWVGLCAARTRARLGGEGLPLATAAILTGLCEIVIAVLLAARSYPRYTAALAGYEHARQALDLGGNFVLGATALVGFCFTWRGLLCLWMFGEGLLRVFGGIAEIPVGTGFGWIIEQTMHALAPKPKVLPLVEDRFTEAGERLVLESCRAHPLAPGIVLERDAVHFTCTAIEASVDAARPFRYVLRRRAEAEVARKLVPYTPPKV